MAIPVQVTFRDMDSSPNITDHVARRASKLEALFDHVVDCHVVVGEPHRHSRNGQKFHVRIDLHVPGKELVVTRNPEDLKQDLYATLDDAFNDAERLLEDHMRTLRLPRKHAQARAPHGIVARVFHDRGYGFIETVNGEEVYFHEHSVLDGKFKKLEAGTKVRFTEEDGDKGPQASTVHVLSKKISA